MTRRFTTDPLDPAVVAELLDLARRAPSAGYSQGVHFLALDGASIAASAQVHGGTSVGRDAVIGEGAVVGMGSVVTRDVAARVVVAGNPARSVRQLEVLPT